MIARVLALLTAMGTGIAGTLAFTINRPGMPTLLAAMCLGFALATIFLTGRAVSSLDDEADRPIAPDRQRTEALAVLAAGLAHELGQPLSAARVGIEGIHYLRQLGRDPSPEHLENTLRRVGLSLIAITQTVEHLKGLSRPDAAAREMVDLGAVVDAVLAEREQWLRFQDSRLQWERPTETIRVLADSAGVRMIVTNLVRNAVEAVAGLPEERRLVTVEVGPGPEVRVRDIGEGIQSQYLEHIFDPFQSSKLGTWRGIGLSLAKTSAERMQGTLLAESVPGKGATFTLRLEAAS